MPLLPAHDFDSGSNTTLIINYEWRRLISDALQSYADSIIRYLDDSLVDDFRNQFQGLLNDLYTAETMDNTPVGMVAWFPITIANIPDKWLLCDGSVQNDADYPELAAILAVDFSGGAGTFVLPDLTDRMLYGSNNDVEVGFTGGATRVTLDVSEMPAHSHVQRGRNSPAGAIFQSTITTNTTNTAPVDTVTTTGITGGGTSHENMPPYMRGYWLIKALP